MDTNCGYINCSYDIIVNFETNSNAVNMKKQMDLNSLRLSDAYKRQ